MLFFSNCNDKFSCVQMVLTINTSNNNKTFFATYNNQIFNSLNMANTIILLKIQITITVILFIIPPTLGLFLELFLPRHCERHTIHSSCTLFLLVNHTLHHRSFSLLAPNTFTVYVLNDLNIV